ncbi:heme peroxidase family protein [Nitrosomonas sp. sh817]|uniref:peroxidase family protein n=1 Tax=Nitrosomonas sp. sh817 TaxID=3070658 RepID=UPI0027DD816A|nr:heme peroxidase family protein [Nitrosomonas sp. sh817]WMJ09386.1 heme peroxidase family protein [Nitrosomonas sp. sh817]
MTRHGSYKLGGDNPPKSTYYEQGKFGRMFPSLPPFATDNKQIKDALKELGKKGGIMDAMESMDVMANPNLARDLIVNPALNTNNPNNPNLSAGMTFLGQFLDHDITFDPTSSLERQSDPESIQNFRTPLFELDSMYGSGPGASPHLYDQSPAGEGIKFYLEEIPGSGAVSADGSTRFDLPRNNQGTALLGDPRNDENLIVSQLHLAMLRFHNAVVDYVKAEFGLSNPDEVFAEAQRLVRWHYQWIIVHEFLEKTVGKPLVDDILNNGRKFYKWRNQPYIPVEFSAAAYRFGHSQVRPSYRSNFGPTPSDVNSHVFKLIFNDGLPDGPDPDDLRGGKRAPSRFIDWQTFFDFGDGNVRPNKKIDTKLSTVLFDLPGVRGEFQSLAQLNLLRGLTFSLPSGQSVAKAMNLPVLDATDLADLVDLKLHLRTPLWFYILREAEVKQNGERLGPVGGRIVAEVFIGLLQGDSMSYLKQDPEWTPTLPSAVADNFKMTDLLKFAGVVARL